MTTSATATAVKTWKLDPAHSNVEFSVRHLMISTVRGRFSDVQGIVKTDDSDPSQGVVDVTVNAATIDTRESQRDAHLKSADFFDVERFPTITFRSTGIRAANDDAFKLSGDLTIHGVTREVVLDVTSEGRTRDPWGGERSGFSATTKIKRSDFGLTWNQLLEAGGVAVSDEVRISIDAQLILAAA